MIIYLIENKTPKGIHQKIKYFNTTNILTIIYNIIINNIIINTLDYYNKNNYIMVTIFKINIK